MANGEQGFAREPWAHRSFRSTARHWLRPAELTAPLPTPIPHSPFATPHSPPLTLPRIQPAFSRIHDMLTLMEAARPLPAAWLHLVLCHAGCARIREVHDGSFDGFSRERSGCEGGRREAGRLGAGAGRDDDTCRSPPRRPPRLGRKTGFQNSKLAKYGYAPRGYYGHRGGYYRHGGYYRGNRGVAAGCRHRGGAARGGRSGGSLQPAGLCLSELWPAGLSRARLGYGAPQPLYFIASPSAGCATRPCGTPITAMCASRCRSAVESSAAEGVAWRELCRLIAAREDSAKPRQVPPGLFCCLWLAVKNPPDRSGRMRPRKTPPDRSGRMRPKKNRRIRSGRM